MKATSLLITAMILAVLVPSFALAQDFRPGTNDYLKFEVELEEKFLTTPLVTEQREAFEIAPRAMTVSDPLGDVVDRVGVENTIQAPWGDIQDASFRKNDETQSWDLVLTLGGIVSEKPTSKVQFLLYADSDGDTSNNDTDGIRVNTDTEFSIQHNEEEGWYADFRWFNAEADFWAFDRTTESTFTISGNSVTLSVPFAELPEDLEPRWRAAVALQDGQETQIDVAPGIGFPPPIGGEFPKKPFRLPELTGAHYVLGASILAVIVYLLWVMKSTKREE